ncbi:MAG: hypothetical protein ACYTG0_35435 [Planctomycetota bacterium]
MKANEIIDMLARRFAQPKFMLLRNVRNSTGYIRGERYADALAFCLWPSGGYALHGFEVKIHRSDWLRELENPAKSAAFECYCTHWWVVAPPKVVKEGEVPLNWGLMEAHGSRLVKVKAAPIRGRDDPPWDLAASMIRQSHNQWIPKSEVQPMIDKAREDGRDSVERTAALKHDMTTDELVRLRKHIKEFEEKSGVLFYPWQMGKIGEAVKVIHDGGIEKTLRDLQLLYNSHSKVTAAIAEALEALEKESK